MTRIKQVGPPVLVVALIAGVVGYILGCTRSEREKHTEVRAEQNDQVAQVVGELGGDGSVFAFFRVHQPGRELESQCARTGRVPVHPRQIQCAAFPADVIVKR